MLSTMITSGPMRLLSRLLAADAQKKAKLAEGYAKLRDEHGQAKAIARAQGGRLILKRKRPLV
jgi:hypothetical protein